MISREANELFSNEIETLKKDIHLYVWSYKSVKKALIWGSGWSSHYLLKCPILHEQTVTTFSGLSRVDISNVENESTLFILMSENYPNGFEITFYMGDHRIHMDVSNVWRSTHPISQKNE